MLRYRTLKHAGTSPPPRQVGGQAGGQAGGRRFKDRPGLGDIMVLIAITGFLSVLLWPLREGNRLGEAEARVRVRSERVARLARHHGLITALAALSDRVRVEPDLEAFTRYYLGREALQFLPTWEDSAYYYRIRLDEDAARGGILIEAEPRRPGSSGRFGFGCDGSGVLDARPVLVDRQLADLDVEVYEMRAKQRCVILARHAREVELPGALARFRGAVRGEIERAPDDTAEGYPQWTLDGYTYRYWPIFEDAGGTPKLTIEILAWPEAIGTTGFATFRIAGTGSVLQTRNLVRPYDGRADRNVPRPGAGLPRTAADAAGHSYLGVDGNLWFHAKTFEAP